MQIKCVEVDDVVITWMNGEVRALFRVKAIFQSHDKEAHNTNRAKLKAVESVDWGETSTSSEI